MRLLCYHSQCFCFTLQTPTTSFCMAGTKPLSPFSNLFLSLVCVSVFVLFLFRMTSSSWENQFIAGDCTVCHYSIISLFTKTRIDKTCWKGINTWIVGCWSLSLSYWEVLQKVCLKPECEVFINFQSFPGVVSSLVSVFDVVWALHSCPSVFTICNINQRPTWPSEDITGKYPTLEIVCLLFRGQVVFIGFVQLEIIFI